MPLQSPSSPRCPARFGRRLLHLLGGASRGRVSRTWLVACGLVAAGAGWGQGAPLTRFYPFEEIGCLSRGTQLAHDRFGRLVVAQQGEFIVLNDTTWQKLWSENVIGINLRIVARAPDGTLYYGAFGSWGVFVAGADGKLQPRSLATPESPPWVRATRFDRILCTEAGVFFTGLGGVVFHGKDGRTRYFEIEGTVCVFPRDGKYLLSTFDLGLRSLDLENGTTARVECPWTRRDAVLAVAGEHRNQSLVAMASGRLLLVRSLQEAQPVDLGQPPASISTLVALPEGGFAVGFGDRGVVLLTEDGRVHSRLTGPEFIGVTALASHEPGVLWAAAESGLSKVLYDQPFTTFGRAAGLAVDWPQVFHWRGRPMVVSGGVIYEPVAAPASGEREFRPIQNRPGAGLWAVAEVGGSLVVATGDRVFAAEGDGVFRPIASGVRAARLVRLDDDTFLAIGTEQVTALRRTSGVWSECAKRAPGVGYPYIVHRGGPASAWVELGLNRVAKFSLEGEELRTRLVDQFPSSEPCWINVSVVDDKVVFCGSWLEPVVVDERTLAPVEAPMLRRLFAESPRRIQRLQRDGRGVLWASHDRGLLRAEARDGRWVIDPGSYAGIQGATPLVTVLPGDDIWASTGSTLYRLRREEDRPAGQGSGPLLVALRDGRTNREIALAGRHRGDLGRFAYAENSLQLDFFAGGYAGPRSFLYEHRLDDSEWRPSAPGAPVFLADLAEGDYRLEVRTVDDLGRTSPVTAFTLAIDPPWYRRWYSYLGYGAFVGGLVVAVHRLSVRRARLRHAALEREVADRTSELRATMARLREETQTNATLAERNRLAAEIHDSLEQGFTGLALQIETTAGLPGCPAPVQSGLAAALGMVGYCRKEIRHAVQGLHAPVLGTSDLVEAIRLSVAQSAPQPGFGVVAVEGQPRRLESATEHHLLRIVQEAVANTVKHAAARRLEVTLAYEEAGLRITVTDDGRGFRPEAVARGTGHHFGLPSLRARAHKFGGTVAIDSQPGAGTTVRVWAPAPQANPSP